MPTDARVASVGTGLIGRARVIAFARGGGRVRPYDLVNAAAARDD